MGGNLNNNTNQEINWDKTFFEFDEYAQNIDLGKISVFSDIESENRFNLIYNYFDTQLDNKIVIGITKKGVLGYLIENEMWNYIGFLFFVLICLLKRKN